MLRRPDVDEVKAYGEALGLDLTSTEARIMHSRVMATIDAALAKAGPLTARNPEPKDVLPYWGKKVQKDGSVTLAKASGWAAAQANPHGPPKSCRTRCTRLTLSSAKHPSR